MLAVSMLLASVPVDALAEGGTSNSESTSFVINLNGSASATADARTVAYGETVSLTLSGYSGSTEPAFIWLPGSETPDIIASWHKWSEGQPTEPGKYYLGYEFDVDSDGSTHTLYDGSYSYTITKSQAAVPEESSWTNGSTASWKAVTTNTNGSTLANGAVAGYKTTLYKDGTAVDSYTAEQNSYDFTDIIKKQGNGIYTFTVQTSVSDTDHYMDSAVSAVSGSEAAVLVSVSAGEGIASVSPSASRLLIAGNTNENIMSVTASVKNGRVFSGWSADPAAAVTIGSASELNSTIILNADYTAGTAVAVSAGTIDTESPSITMYEAGTGADYGVLKGSAADEGSAVSQYAFSTAKTAAEVAEGEWQNAPANGAGVPASFQHTVSAAGTYYLYVKDASGNTAKSGSGIQATEVKYDGYYENGTAQSTRSSFIVGDKALVLSVPSRPGYTSNGWHLLSDCSDTAVAEISAQSTDAVTVYTKWTHEAIHISDQPDNYSGEYDGADHTLSVTVDNTAGTISYQWYKGTADDRQPVDGAVSSEYSVKTTADTGVYSVQITISQDGNDISVFSDAAVVSITAKRLTITAENKELTYGDTAGEGFYTYTSTGYIPGENESVLTVGTISCAYDPASADNSAANVYPITAAGFSAENYTIGYVSGNLTVDRKNGSTGADMSSVLDKTDWTYTGQEIKPAVTVKDGMKQLSESTDYTVTYSSDVNAGTAAATILFTGNYTGSTELTYTISKATFTADVILHSWIYGENAASPALSTNVSGGAASYYYYGEKETRESAVETVPTEAGSYYVYAVIAATDNYEQVTTEPKLFAVEKRTITLTAYNGSWIFDGNAHARPLYQQQGEFAGTDGFLSVSVTGTVTNVGVAENAIEYALTSSTKADNYNIQTVNGTLEVMQCSLSAPGGSAWNDAVPGKAEWIALTRDSLTVSYTVQLYRVVNGNYYLIDSENTDSNSYDFSNSIKKDSADKGVAGYCFNVKAVPSGGDNQLNYSASSYSDNAAVIYTASVSVTGGIGVASALIDGVTNEILFQGQSFTLTAEAKTGYSFSGNVWSEASGNAAIDDVNSKSTTAKLSNKITEGKVISIAASCIDDAPVITDFSAEAYDNNSKVRFSLSATDTKSITAWAITNSGTEEPDTWHEITPSKALDRQTLDNITAAGTYYAWVKDDFGQITCSAARESGMPSIGVYEIAFSAGEQGTGAMDTLLKVENKPVTLPVCAFTRQGFNFRNWSGASGLYANTGIYTANSSDTLTAQWTDEQFRYTVNYYLMGTDGSYPEDPSQTIYYTGGYGKVISTSSTEIALSNKGMAPDTNMAGSITLTENGLVLNVHYKRLQYTITYSYTMPDNTKKSFEQAYYYGETVTEADKPAADGYTFIGWQYGNSGRTPDTMPAENLTAAGSFTANQTSYKIHYYEENIPVNAGDAEVYTLVDTLDKTIVSRHGTAVSASITDAEAIDGFTAAYVTVSLGDVGGTVPQEKKTTASGTVSADESTALNINYYYTRNTYKLTLNVYSSNLRTDCIYTYSVDKMFGETINADAFANYNKTEWKGAPEDSTLADYADWSTGAAPALMPAGNVTVSRDYVKATEAAYKVEIYYETAAEGTYSLQSTLTYYAAADTTVTIGGTNAATINYNGFDGSLYEFKYYTFSEKNADNVLLAAVKADGTTTLKVYFERKTVTSTITYYYNAGQTESGASTADVRLASVTKSGKWGTTYTYEPLALFDGSGIPDAWENNYTVFDADKAGSYNFKAEGYLASYSGRYLQDGDYHWPGRKFTEASMLTDYAGDSGVFGQESNAVNVYYNKIVHTVHYTVDMYYNPSRLVKSGDTANHPLTVSVDGTEYKVRIANKADIFESTWVMSASEAEITSYPVLADYKGSYSYGETETLKSGFTAVTVDGSVYYLNSAAPGYIYVADAENQFFYGSRVSYNFLRDELNNALVGYSSVEKYLSDYKAAHNDSADVSTYDPKNQSAYIYNGGFSPIMYNNGTYTFTFDYGRIYTVTYIMDGNTCSDHTYAKNQPVTVGCDNKTLFPDKAGFSIVWYTDNAYTNKAADFNITDNTILYGRYEKNTVTYKINNYYQLPDNGKFITDPGTEGLTSTTEKQTVSFTDGSGNTADKAITITKYYSGTALAMQVSEIPVLTYTDVSLDYNSYLLDGFVYDSANSDNLINGYCADTGISLASYYTRNEYTFTYNTNSSAVSNDEKATYRTGQSVSLAKPVKAGYAFAGWTWTEWTGTEWISWDKAPAASEDGSVTFAMPQMNIRADASWTPADYTTTMVHYFQTPGKTYATELYSSLSSMGSSGSVNITFNGSTYTGSLYKNGESIIGASFVMNGKTWYFSAASESDGTYTAKAADLIAAAEPVTYVSGTEIPVSGRILDLTDYSMFAFGFAVYQDEKGIKNLSSSDTFVYGPDMSAAYYYSRAAGYTVDVSGAATDSGDSGLTLVGGGSYCYGENVSVRAAAAAGYTFMGWYASSDTTYQNPVSTDLIYSFDITENKTLVAVSKPDTAAEPNVTLSGTSAYSYGYASSGSNVIRTAVSFGEGTSSANKVASYQWYEISGDSRNAMEGETSATYVVPTGKACGTYTYQCDVTIIRNDNGRSATVSSDLHSITVSPVGMTVKAADYTGTYDGKAHGITVTVTKPSADAYKIYYSTTELTEKNYTTGLSDSPTFKDVVMNGSTAGSYTVYYYIHNLDGNFNDMAASALVTIKPAAVTLNAAGSYHRKYDGTTKVSGSVTEAGTGKYVLSRGTYFTVTGLLDAEKDLYIADFDADFNSKDVDSASSVTLSNIKIVSKDTGSVNCNYNVSEGYTLAISGYITRYILYASWDTSRTFLYDGTEKIPGIHLDSTAGLPDSAVADSITVSGGQINAGTYTAYASVADSDAYKLSNYMLSTGSTRYTITKRDITITPSVPEAGSVIYDGSVHYVRDFSIGGSGLAEVNGVSQTYTAETDQGAVNAGTTVITAKNMLIYQDGMPVTDNYSITYGSAGFAVGKKTVTVSGFTADNKTYDGTDTAVIHTDKLIFAGIASGDTLSISAEDITGTFDSASAGMGKTVSVALESDDLKGASAGNYILDTVGSTCTASADITAAVITVTGTNVNTVYGETADFGVTYSGFVNGENQSVISGAANYSIKSGSSAAEEYSKKTAAGSYNIVLDVNGLSADNYIFKAAGTAAVLTVAKRPLALAASESPTVTKTYDGTTSAAGCVSDDDWRYTGVVDDLKSGIVNGDAVTLSFSAVYDSKEVSAARIVTMSGLSVSSNNYELTASSLDIPGCVITQKNLTVAVLDKVTVYGQAAPSYTVAYSGFAAGENKSVLGGTLTLACDYNIADPGNRSAKKYTITADGYTSNNYHISYTLGILRVNPAVITVTANAETITYGKADSVPAYSSTYSGFQYQDDDSVITGTVTTSCSMTYLAAAGTYAGAIVPDTSGLHADNYTFKAVSASLTVSRHEIRISGITVNAKTYDGTTAVASSQIQTGAAVYDGILADDVKNEGLVVTASYASANVGEAVGVSLNVSLNTYLAARYTLVTAESQSTAAADITQKNLTVTVDSQAIRYGADEPAYTVQYSGFVQSETKDVLSGNLSYTETYTADSGSGTYSPAGSYTVSAGGYLQNGNYHIQYVDGILTVNQAKLAAPSVTWNTVPGTADWTSVSGIGAVSVGSYTVELIETISNKTVKTDHVAADVLSYNFLSAMRENGAGNYQVKVTAVASANSNAEKANVADSNSSISTGKKAAKVSVKFSDDAVSQKAKAEMTDDREVISIGSDTLSSYVMIAGESGAAITANLKNKTGYSVASLVSGSSELTVTSPMLDLTGKVVTSAAAISSTLSSSSEITVTLTMNATPATLTMNITADPDTAVFGYTSSTAPKLTANVGLEAADNLTDISEYDYTYQWYMKEGGTGKNSTMENGQDSVVVFPTGKTAADNKYWVTCEVTATRKDNGMTKTITTLSQLSNKTYFNVVIKRAEFSSQVSQQDWTYGQTRTVPAVTYNPGNGAVLYQYNTESNTDLGWTATIPKDAGVYYVRAYISQTANYNAFQTQAVKFTIGKAKLMVPDNLAMGESSAAPYGLLSWGAVGTFSENNGVSADSTVSVTYRFTLYRSDTDSASDADWTAVYTEETANTSIDVTSKITQKGYYRFTVTALAACSNNKDNCDNSDESERSAEVLDIKSTMGDGDAKYEYSKEYDGNAITLKSSNDLGEDVSYQWLRNNEEVADAAESTLDLTYVGQSGTYTCKMISDGKTYYSSNHIVTITPLTVTFTSDTQTKVYDGTALKGLKKSVTTLGTGDTIAYTLPDITDAGSKTNTITGVVITHNGEKVVFTEGGTGNCYTLVKVPGTLSVTQRSLADGEAYNAGIEVSQPSAAVYDGTAHTPSVTVTDTTIQVGEANKILTVNTDYTAVYSSNIHAGTNTALITITGIGNYSGTIRQYFTIAPKNITLAGGSTEREYNGTTLTNHTCAPADGTALASGDSIDASSVVCDGSIIDLGSTANNISAAVIRNASQMDVTSDYNITKKPGTLTIKVVSAVITITADSSQKMYDGSEITDSGYSFTKNILKNGDVLTAVTAGTQTDHGSSANKIKSYTVKRDDFDVTKDYTIQTADGKLTITRRDVTLTSASQTREYDGTPLTNSKVAESGWADGQGATYTVTGSQLDHGSSKNVFSYLLNSNTNADNYTITKTEGTLTVNPVSTPVTITANSGTKLYDGTPLTNAGYTYAPNVLVEGDILSATVQGTQTDAGESLNKVTIYTVMRGETDVTADYTFNTSIDGKLDVTKRKVVMTSGTAEKVYDDTPLVNQTVTVTGDGFIEGEGAAYNVTGSQLDQGSSSNTFIYTLNDGTKAGNYTISTAEGTLTVTPILTPITITADSGSKTYDGAALTEAGCTYTPNVLLKGNVLTAVTSGSQTNAGSSSNVISSYTVKRGDKDITNDYTFTASDAGTLTVNKKNVTITSDDLKKEYNGTALVNGTAALKENSGWVNGQGIDVTFTGSQLDVGNSTNAFTYTAKSGTNLENYTITKTEGTLIVTKNSASITITASDAERKYNGSPLTAGYTYTPGVIAAIDSLSVVINSSQTDTGASVNTVSSYRVMRGTKDVTSYYTFADCADGTLTVTKRSLTLTSASQQREYYGTALKNGEVAPGGDGFASGEGASYDVTGSQTYVGSSKNVFTYQLNESTKAVNYDIVCTEGDLTIVPVSSPITITADSNTKKYDGTALTDNGYTYTREILVSGDTLTAIVAGTQTDAGSSANTVTGYQVMRGTTDVTSDYTFTGSIDGALTVTKRSLTLTSASQSREYDGTALKNSEMTPGGDGFASGEGASYDVTGSQTYVGSSKNVFTYQLNESTKAVNYDIVCTEGDLTIVPVSSPITITADSNTKKYDGTALTDNGYTYTKEILVSGDTLTATVEGTQTDAGSSANTVTGYQVMRGTADVTSDYTFAESVPGTLVITKRSVTLTSASQSREYDGTALKNSEVTPGGDGFASGEGASYDVTGSQTYVGSSKNVFTYILNADTNADNYTIAMTEGYLTIIPVSSPITITADSNTKKYDGTALTDNGYSYTEEILVSGDTLTATVEGTQTDVGSSANTVTGYQVMRGTTDVTSNYTFADNIDGALTVMKRSLTLTSASQSREYDGTALKNSEVIPGGDGFAEGEGASYDVTGSQTYVGSSKNVFTYTLNTDTNADNYTIAMTEGDLTIVPVSSPITITADSNTKKYDGTALTDNGYTYTKEILVSGDTLTATVEGTQTDAGSSANIVTGYQVMRGTTDVTSDYTFAESVPGTLVITKRSVTLTSESQSREYDGTALKNSEVTPGGDGFASGEGASYDVTGSQTYVGSSKNVFTYTLNADTNADNYDIVCTEGDLTIVPVSSPITITADSNTKKYDGTALTDNGYTYTKEILVNGDTLTATVEGTQTDAGSSANTVTGYQVMRGTKDVTSDYTFAESVPGTLVITKRSVTLTSASQSREYDGTALKNSTVTPGGDRFAEGEGASYDVTGSQTYVGSSKNTFTYTLNADTNADNYTIAMTEGDLTIIPVSSAITITADSNTKKYDGTALTDNGYTYMKEILVSGDTLTATVEGTQTDVGTSTNTVTGYQVMRGTTDVTSDYTFAGSIDGALTVTKRSLTLTSASQSREYDGTALKNSEVIPGGDGFAEGEGASYDVTGSQTYVGSSKNEFTYQLNEGTKAVNYNIVCTEGDLTIVPVSSPITITADSNTKKYDGTALTDNGYTYTKEILVSGDTLTATVEGTQTDAGSSANTVTGYQVMRGTTDVTLDYTFAGSIDGALTVTKRSLTLTSASQQREYDGPH